jgi:3-deoxy-manno-octulosonate cytidylyltransferase (CMP-KDO synthetase)
MNLIRVPIVGIIPSRIGSKRFPGKPLAMLGNKTMIARVVERTLESGVCHHVLVATDDERIAHQAEKAGAQAFLTDSQFANGTLRSHDALKQWETLHKCKADAVLSIQGDEPFVHPEQLRKLAHLIRLPGASVATLARAKEALDPGRSNKNRVKVVCDLNGRALFFSRAALPSSPGSWFEHVGLYAFTRGALEALSFLHASPLEKRESLEQLRWLEHGWHIHVGNTSHATYSVDTPEDLDYLETLLKSGELT